MTVLYRKYRPQKLAELEGQPTIVETLLKQLETGKISHAYIFSGPRGTGKTSTARILAKALNCALAKEEKFAEPCGKCDACVAIAQGQYLDLVEIDAASNRGIDEIRELREKIRFSPTQGRFKVYIIDEVHMLTSEAFNALLKTLEEPPAHAVFILATTEPQKVPATILSRAQKFAFQRPSVATIVERLKKICQEEGWNLKEDALAEIAKAADGAFRDAEVLLDKVGAVDTKATGEQVRRIIGREEEKTDLLGYLVAGKTKEALEWLDKSLIAGVNVRLLLESYIETLRNILLIKEGLGKDLIKVREEFYPELENYAQKLTHKQIFAWVNLFTQALVDLRYASIPQLPFELAIIEAIGFEKDTEISDLEEVKEPSQSKLEKVEELVIEEKAVPPSEKTETIKVVVENRTGEEKTEGSVKVKNIQSGKVRLKEIEKVWDKVLEKLKPKNNSLEIFLRGASPKEVDEGVLTIEFGYRFHKDRFEEPKNRQLLEGILAELLGETVRIKGIVGSPKPRVKNEEVQEEIDPVEVFGKIE